MFMELDKIKNKGQARLFKNDFMEMMTKTHPVVIYTIYFPIILFMLYSGAVHRHIPVINEAVLFICGVFFWTFFEYLMHRYLFHMMVERPKGKRFIYMMHGVHHEYPRDKERLFMPPVPSLIVACVLFFIMYIIVGWSALAFFPGFLLGYILYGSMHFAIHAFAPPKGLKALWRNHHVHHYRAPDKGYGVSSVLWDIVFHTVPEKDRE
jgi:4-hydroxysphinganine ceramide fatty acyl 2-hydroxylase